MRTAQRFFAFAMLLAACSASHEEGTSNDDKSNTSPPDLSGGKADSLHGVLMGGPLDFGTDGAVSGEFSADDQYFGFPFLLPAAGSITVATTQRGTSARLDNTLFLYRVADTSAYEYLGWDDDSGYGKQASIEELTLEPGRYLAVTGTASGRGRGQFRIELTCAQGECTNPFSSCIDEAFEVYAACVTEKQSAGDALTAAIVDCVDNGTNDVMERLCNSASKPAWCYGGAETIDFYLVPLCQARLHEELGVAAPLTWQPLAIPQDILDQIVAADEKAGDWDYSEVHAVAFTYDPAEAASIARLAETAAVAAGWPAAVPTDEGIRHERKTTELTSDELSHELGILWLEPAAFLSGLDAWMGSNPPDAHRLEVIGETDGWTYDYFRGPLLVYPDQATAVLVYMLSHPES